MVFAEGKYFEVKDTNVIDEKVLETLPYRGNPQKIEYVTDEFSAVCPFSGLPDMATIRITYTPQDHLVELKSLKYYFVSYRSVGIYQEDVTQRIFQDLKNLLSPAFLEVKTIYKTRGGIDATCTMRSDEM